MAITQVSGKVTYLRVHDLGTGYGSSPDFLDAEAIIKLDRQPTEAFGFQLRSDDHLPAREGMLQVLLEAYRNNWTVGMDVDKSPGRHNHMAIRVWTNR